MTAKDTQNQHPRWRSVGLIAVTFLIVYAGLAAVESVSAGGAIVAAASIVVVGLIVLKAVK